MRTCFICQKETEDLLKTDGFGQMDPCTLCPDCFYEQAKVAFNHPNFVCKCGERLVLTEDKQTIIEHAHTNDPITYRCQYVEDARILSRYECVIELDELHEKRRVRSVGEKMISSSHNYFS